MPIKPETHRPRHAERSTYDKAYNRRRNRGGGANVERMRSGRRWKWLRAEKLKASPLCELCKREGIDRPAAEVHHIQGAHSRPDLFYVMENLMALCVPCHRRIDARPT